jgi:hypothetical protein
MVQSMAITIWSYVVNRVSNVPLLSLYRTEAALDIASIVMIFYTRAL